MPGYFLLATVLRRMIRPMGRLTAIQIEFVFLVTMSLIAIIGNGLL